MKLPLSSGDLTQTGMYRSIYIRFPPFSSGGRRTKEAGGKRGQSPDYAPVTSPEMLRRIAYPPVGCSAIAPAHRSAAFIGCWRSDVGSLPGRPFLTNQHGADQASAVRIVRSLWPRSGKRNRSVHFLDITSGNEGCHRQKGVVGTLIV